MINILVPMAGKSQYFSDTEYPFPKPLIEIGQKTIIEHVVTNLANAGPTVQFIFSCLMMLFQLYCRNLKTLMQVS